MLAAPEREVTVHWPARAPGPGGLHAGAWLAWFAAATAAMFLTSNPLYLSLGFLAACVVYASVLHTPMGRAMRPVVVMALAFAALSLPFNVLTGSSGPTVLATLPEVSFPRTFGGVTFGGAITAEALVTAAGRAITIATLGILAAAFSAGVDHHRLLRLAPRPLAQLALVLTIAVLMAPQAVEQVRALLEARRLRGRAGGGLRAAPFIVLPALRGALERSVQRAESLDARGFGGRARRLSRAETVVAVCGLGICSWGAFAHYYFGAGLAPAAAMAVGALLVIAPLLRTARAPEGWRRRDPWQLADVAVVLAAIASAALVLALRWGGGSIEYIAYPAVRMPAFHAAGAVAFGLLIAPGLAGRTVEDKA